ncbi:hypothetical protein JOC93_000204 [Priestia taiwanensis]|nr:hypothetical protein [Priestia taiwanensis]
MKEEKILTGLYIKIQMEYIVSTKECYMDTAIKRCEE